MEILTYQFSEADKKKLINRQAAGQRTRFAASTHWVGELGEMAFERWAEHSRVEAARPKALVPSAHRFSPVDFGIRLRDVLRSKVYNTVDVKAHSGKMTVMQPWFTVAVNADQLPEIKADLLVFTYCNTETLVVYLLGWLPAIEFRHRGTLRSKGESMGGGFYRSDCYTVPYEELYHMSDLHEWMWSEAASSGQGVSAI